MARLPLRWAFGDRAMWRGRCVTLEYVAEDAALVTFAQFELLDVTPRTRCAIAPIGELEMRAPSCFFNNTFVHITITKKDRLLMSSKKAAALKFDAKTGYPFAKGDAVLIRTVTMYQVGRVVNIGPDSITLVEASWLADIGRLSAALESGALSEVEKIPSWCVVGRGAIVDIFPWPHPLPTATK